MSTATLKLYAPQPEPLTAELSHFSTRDGLVCLIRTWSPDEVDNCRLCRKCSAFVHSETAETMCAFGVPDRTSLEEGRLYDSRAIR
jgi:hypothetical protein